jgi:hypothetical protein
VDDMTHVNEEALKLAMKAIREDPAHWDQAVWWDDVDFVGSLPLPLEHLQERCCEGCDQSNASEKIPTCDTTYCLAGYAILQAGLRMNAYDSVFDADGKYLGNPMEVGQELLGLDTKQAMALFHSGLDQVSEFEALVTQMTGVSFDD